MKKINDKAVETVFTVAVVFGLSIIITQILITTIVGIINLFQ
jgi:hypothetical protein